MPFNQNRSYGIGTQEVTHQSVAAKGRGLVTADFVTLSVNNVEVGLVQRVAPRENRDVIPQYEIGNQYIVEFVPSVWSGTLEISRLELFKDNLFNAFQYNSALSADTYDLKNYWPANKVGPSTSSAPNSPGSGLSQPIVTTLADIQWPIDLAINTINPAPDVNDITTKTYQECWITSIGSSYDSGAKTVMESVTFVWRNAVVTQSSINTFATNQFGNGQNLFNASV